MMSAEEISINEEQEDELAEAVDEEGVIEADAEVVEVENTKTRSAEKESQKRAYKKPGTVTETSTLSLDKVDKLTSFISGITGLISEANIVFGPEGISIIAMDAANVAMVTANINKSSFTEYKACEGAVYGVNLLNLKAMLKRGGKSSSLKLAFNDHVNINMTAKDRRISYELPLLADLEDKKPELPKMDFKAGISIKTADFSEAVSDAEIISDSLSLLFNDNKASFEAIGEKSNKVVIDLPGKSVGENCKSKYSMEYLKKIIPKGFEKVKLETSKDYPLMATYEEKDMSIKFLIAPRVENN
jgi:DNA polymerase III sliding clamp (beta) subunit (PCNA family)